jgi:TolB protein
LWRVPSIGSVGLQHTETQHPQRDVHPSLSPDGSSILFYSNRSGSWDIWQLDLNNATAPRQITDWPGNELYPTWSPDAQQLAFVSDKNGNADIWIQRLDGTDAQPMAVSPAEEVWCAWSRDQRWFFFVSNRDGNYNVWRMPATGGEAEPLTHFDDPAFGLPENSIYTKFAAGPTSLILSLESRKGDIYVLKK